MKKWIVTFTERVRYAGVIEAKTYDSAITKAQAYDWFDGYPEDTGDSDGKEDYDASEAHKVDGAWEAKDS
tara:strand:+ start:1282 stop:1491 length:210 start_codon:yes stop_codon:yes gene_type:complete